MLWIRRKYLVIIHQIDFNGTSMKTFTKKIYKLILCTQNLFILLNCAQNVYLYLKYNAYIFTYKDKGYKNFKKSTFSFDILRFI